MQDNFVLPRVGEFTSFHELDDNYSRYGNLFPSLNKGTNPIAKKNFFQRAFVVADPGYGKTRLLKEVVAEVADQDKIAIYVDLKKFADSKQSSLKEYLKSRSEKLKECDLRDLKFDEAVICFDALDEIRNRRFTSSLNTLKKFVSSYPDLSILISSRLHFFKNKLFKISDLDFKYWLIYAFSHSQIRKYLSSEDVSSSEINSILSLFTNNNRDLIISVPRYLKLLPEYLKQNEVSNLNRLNRTNLFEFFIFYKLDLEERRSEAKGKEIIQRVLEMLALTMEIYQTNVLSKSELTTFLDEISSGLSQFWHNIPLKVFFDNSLLKDNNDTIEFENTEFQEYLAAKHLSRLNRPLQVTFDLVIDTHAKEIKPTWFSTLEFLTELDQNFLKPLLDFGKRNKNKPVIDERYFKLLTQFNIDQLSNDKKEEVFKLVFEYYQRVMHWLDWAVGKNLSFYYTQPVYDSLKVYAKKSISDFQNKDQRYVQLANVCQIIGYLIRHQKLTKKQIDYWREKLVTYANEAGGPGVLQRHALFALEAFKDPTLITDITGPWYHEESLVRRRFIEFCIAVDPNDKTAIEYFTDAVITKVHKGLSSIGKITSADSLKYLFELFLSEDQLLEAYLVEDRSGFTTSGAKLLQNLESIWNHDLEE
ncbi:MAG: hypothetical protein U9O78_03580, partial [Patescibacteria group bacterium]|nr:hypothetical protein [Patescibacteria group bacterium]